MNDEVTSPPGSNEPIPEVQPVSIRIDPNPAAPDPTLAPILIPAPAAAAAPAPTETPEAARKRPEWKVLEPEDKTDPVPHELLSTVRLHGPWCASAASVRGKLHAHKGSYREDAFEVAMVDTWSILAMSDGAGSARLARIGSRVACSKAVQCLRPLLGGYMPKVTPDGKLLVGDMRRLQTFLSEAARKAQLGILREAQTRKCPAKDFNATFLLVVHTPWGDGHLVAGIQVGDGAVGMFLEDDSCVVLGVADHGEYSSETRFLTTPGIEYEFDSRCFASVKPGLRCLAVMCDGISDDFFPEDRRLIELFLGNPIRDLKSKTGEPVRGIWPWLLREPSPEKALLDWMSYEKKGSFDDRTLIVMYRSEVP